MNSTCIHLRAKDLNIYRRERIYIKKSWRNTIIEKANTCLIPPQTHGGSTTLSLERKLMMSASLSLREEICQLEL
jgi:hypothetical protein